MTTDIELDKGPRVAGQPRKCLILIQHFTYDFGTSAGAVCLAEGPMLHADDAVESLVGMFTGIDKNVNRIEVFVDGEFAGAYLRGCGEELHEPWGKEGSSKEELRQSLVEIYKQGTYEGWVAFAREDGFLVPSTKGDQEFQRRWSDLWLPRSETGEAKAQHPLVDQFFHTWKNGVPSQQGCVLGVIDSRDGELLKVEFYEWLTGFASGTVLMKLSSLVSDCKESRKATWYDSAEEMRSAYLAWEKNNPARSRKRA